MLLTRDGQIFGCGLADKGQLGIVEQMLQGRAMPCNQVYV